MDHHEFYLYIPSSRFFQCPAPNLSPSDLALALVIWTV